jgi:hypothetical protein
MSWTDTAARVISASPDRIFAALTEYLFGRASAHGSTPVKLNRTRQLARVSITGSLSS